MRYRTQFLLSATDPAQFPTSGAPEIAFLGRSNVGKSSLLNALVGEKAAKVSSTPGRTRAINFFALTNADTPENPHFHPKFVFSDLPGYGYAKISKSISSTWPTFIEPYVAERPQLKLCICLIDAKIPAQESDRVLLDWLRHTGRSFAVVGTKADRLSGNERTRNLAALKRDLEVEDLFLISSKTGFGLKTLWQHIESAAQ
jgi:GTP-binding protein